MSTSLPLRLSCLLGVGFPQFVYPDGMRLCSHEMAPTTFAFVLTNSCGLKMHGAVLHVTEEMDPRHLGGMVSKALSTSSGAEGAGVGGQQQQQQRSRTGKALTPAQLPTWLRDTVRDDWLPLLLLLLLPLLLLLYAVVVFRV